MVFPVVHVWMWELDYKESWVPKNWCFWTMVLEKTLESPLDYKEIQPVHPKGNQSWIFIGRTDTEAEAPILSPPDAKNWLIGKDPDAGKDWRQEEKGMTKDEMVGWHHRLDGHEINFGSRWWTGKPGVLQSMELQRVGHDWVIRTSFSTKMTGLFYLLTFENNIFLKSNFERTLWSWPLCPQTHSLPFLCPPSSAVTSVAHSPEAPVQSSAPVAWPSLELYALNLVTAFCCRSHSLEGNEFQLTPAEFHRAWHLVYHRLVLPA